MSEQQFNQPTVETTTALSTQPESVPTMFNFDGTTISVIIRDGQEWWIAGEIASVLDYREAYDMTRNLDPDESAPHNMRIRSENGIEQERQITIINESGLFHAIFNSRKPEAHKFRKWVTSEVLPKIRKTGSYTHPTAQTGDQFKDKYIALLEDHCKLLTEKQTLRTTITADGTRTRRFFVTPEEVEYWVDLYSQGHTFHAISRMVGRAKNTVHCHITAALHNSMEGAQNV